MKKVIFTLVCGAMLLGSCGSNTTTGLFGGAMIGSAIGGIAGGPRGHDMGLLMGAATGAAVGAAVDASEAEKYSRRSNYDDDMYSYNTSGTYVRHSGDKYDAVRAKIRARNGGSVTRYESNTGGGTTTKTTQSVNTDDIYVNVGPKAKTDTTTTLGSKDSGYSKSGGYNDKFEMK